MIKNQPNKILNVYKIFTIKEEKVEAFICEEHWIKQSYFKQLNFE